MAVQPISLDNVKKIFVDLDGVLCDFVDAASIVNGCGGLPAHWPPGEYDVAAVLGLSSARFWDFILNEGVSFWQNLAIYPWANDLLGLVSEAEYTILSAPSLEGGPDEVAGKIWWMNNHLGPRRRHILFSVGPFRNYVLTPRKHLLAGSGRVLIDDCDANAKRFSDAGGRSITFPQPWNNNWDLADDRIGHVERELKRINRELGAVQ